MTPGPLIDGAMELAKEANFDLESDEKDYAHRISHLALVHAYGEVKKALAEKHRLNMLIFGHDASADGDDDVELTDAEMLKKAVTACIEQLEYDIDSGKTVLKDLKEALDGKRGDRNENT